MDEKYTTKPISGEITTLCKRKVLYGTEAFKIMVSVLRPAENEGKCLRCPS
jgi:hypothetical protein